MLGNGRGVRTILPWRKLVARQAQNQRQLLIPIKLLFLLKLMCAVQLSPRRNYMLTPTNMKFPAVQISAARRRFGCYYAIILGRFIRKLGGHGKTRALIVAMVPAPA